MNDVEIKVEEQTPIDEYKEVSERWTEENWRREESWRR